MNNRAARCVAPCAARRATVLAASLFFFLILVGCASGHREPSSGLEPEVRNLVEFETRLRRLAGASDHLELQELGRVQYGEFQAPIWVVYVRPEQETRRVFVCGGLHGNEPAGVEWVMSLLGDLAADPGRYPDTAFEIVPLINPWGWSRDARYNPDGRDINRDFASWNTQEARLLRGLFDGTSYDLVLDHHEDPDAEGFYLYQYAIPSAESARAAVEAVRGLGFPIEQNVSMVILKTRDGLIDAPLWGLRYMRLSRQLSLTNYLRLGSSPRVYTIETPVTVSLEERVAVHRTAFDTLIAMR